MTTPVRGRASAPSERLRRRPSKTAFELVEWKLHPPAARAGIVERTRQVERLMAAHTIPVVVVVAPPGYGKTTLLAQWADRRSPRAAWVSLDDADNDAAVLLTYVAAALDRIDAIDPLVFRALASSESAITVVPRLVAAIAAMERPVVVVLDHVEALTSPDCLDVIAELALHFPSGSQLALASRDPVPLPAARLRAQGGVIELGAGELAMGDDEAPELLEGAGVVLGAGDVAALVERTEGWPAGLYLAALAMKAGSPHAEAGYTFSSDDRFMGDYLRSELLDRVARLEVDFLTRTSILEEMCGPLCDALLGGTGSAKILDQLERRNLMVVPLDRRRQWYRYHHLFRELLYGELRQREPGAVGDLHQRAAIWLEANGRPESAIEHAQAAGDTDRVARLVVELAQPVWASGRVDTVLHWMEWLEREHLIERYPELAVHGSLIFALLGRPSEAERWAASAERASSEATLADGSTTASLLAYLRALLCRDGVGEMRRDAQLGWDGLSPASPYRATMLHARGMADLLEGHPERADPILAQAVDDATRVGASPLAALILAQRATVAIDRDDWTEAEALAERGLSIVADGGLDDYWTSALVYACGARVALHRGDVATGRECVARAARLRPLLTYALPVVSVQALIELARAYIALSDPAGARAVLRQVDDVFQQRPDLGNLAGQAEHLRSTLVALRGDAVGASSLTAAELRLLPLLPTHLSFAEIGERLFISRNTVKTHAIAIYRKLGVSSRGDAIRRLSDLGLHVGYLSD